MKSEQEKKNHEHRAQLNTVDLFSFEIINYFENKPNNSNVNTSSNNNHNDNNDNDSSNSVSKE